MIGEKSALLLNTGSGESSSAVHLQNAPGTSERKRLGVSSTTFFIVTGVMNTIPLPFALKQSGLISGVLLMLFVAASMVYMAVVLGRCWVIMAERWPEHYANKQIRRPYPTIAQAAGGRLWFYLVGISVNVTNIGTAVVDLLVTVATIQILAPGHFSDRIWLLLCTAASLPFVWLGRPMESWTVGWAGGITGIVGTLLLLAGVVVAGVLPAPPTPSPTSVVTNASVVVGGEALASTVLHAAEGVTTNVPVTFQSFWIGVSTLSFTFAGMSIFPSLQHDMQEPRQWWRSVIIAYVIITVLCLVTAVMGFEYFGQNTMDNIIGNVQCQGSHTAVVIAKVVSVIFIVQFLCNAIVSILPVVQDFEEFINDHVTKLPAGGKAVVNPDKETWDVP